MECIIHSDSPPKVQVLKGTETVLEDKKHFAKIEKINEVGLVNSSLKNLCQTNLMYLKIQGEYSVTFQINEATKADEGNYKFVVQNEKGETTSEMIEVTAIPELEKKGTANKYLGLIDLDRTH